MRKQRSKTLERRRLLTDTAQNGRFVERRPPVPPKTFFLGVTASPNAIFFRFRFIFREYSPELGAVWTSKATYWLDGGFELICYWRGCALSDAANDHRTPLEKIADLLLIAHGLTVEDCDPVLTLQIETALLHVARRLAGARATDSAQPGKQERSRA